MKYIKFFDENKIFEDLNSEYEIGDYVKYKKISSVNRGILDNNLKLISKGRPTFVSPDSEMMFYGEGQNDWNNAINHYWIYPYEIDRKMTSEEIEEWELKKAMQKYNL